MDEIKQQVQAKTHTLQQQAVLDPARPRVPQPCLRTQPHVSWKPCFTTCFIHPLSDAPSIPRGWEPPAKPRQTPGHKKSSTAGATTHVSLQKFYCSCPPNARLQALAKSATSTIKLRLAQGPPLQTSKPLPKARTPPPTCAPFGAFLLRELRLQPPKLTLSQLPEHLPCKSRQFCPPVLVSSYATGLTGP